MIVIQPRAAFYDAENKRFLHVGDRVIGTENSDYAGLIGSVSAIRDGKDKETENDTPDVYVSFEYPVLPHMVKTIEERFSDLYGEKKELYDLCFDEVIMAPEEIRVIGNERRLIWVLLAKGKCADVFEPKAFLSAENARIALGDAVRTFKEQHIVCTEESDDCRYQARDKNGAILFAVSIRQIPLSLQGFMAKQDISISHLEESRIQDIIGYFEENYPEYTERDDFETLVLNSKTRVTRAIDHSDPVGDAHWACVQLGVEEEIGVCDDF